MRQGHGKTAPGLRAVTQDHCGKVRAKTMPPDSGRALLIYTGFVQSPVALRCVRKG